MSDVVCDIPAEDDSSKRAKLVHKWIGEYKPEYVKENWEAGDDKKKLNGERKSAKPVKAKYMKAPKAETAHGKRRHTQNTVESQPDTTETAANSMKIPHMTTIQTETKGDFKDFALKITSKMQQYKDSPYYKQLVQDVVQKMCTQMPLRSIKKIKNCVDDLHSQKLRQEKKKKKSKAKNAGNTHAGNAKNEKKTIYPISCVPKNFANCAKARQFH